MEARTSSEEGAPSPGPSRPVPWRRFDLVAWGVLPALIAIAAYAWTLGGFFLSDDFELLELAASAGGWREAAAMDSGSGAQWIRPVGMWSWRGQWLLFGADPFAFRAFNVGLHAVASVLVAWLGGVLIGGRRAGAVAGTAFALAAVHPEAVTWVSGRFDLLCTIGVLVCLLGWLRASAPDGGRRHLAVSLAGLAFALGSKEMALGGPLLVLALDLALREGGARERLTRLAPYGLVLGAYLLLRWRLFGGLGGIEGDEGRSLHARFDLGRSADYLRTSLSACVFPRHADLHPAFPHPLQLLVLAALAVAASIQLAVVGPGRQALRVGCALLLFAVSMAPVLGWGGLLPNLEESRLLYLPSVFACLLVADLLRDPGPASRARPALGAATILVLGTWSVALTDVNRTWVKASAITRTLLEDLPPVSPEATIVTPPLPDNHLGAYVFRNAFEHAVARFTDHSGDVRVVREAEWRRLHADGPGRPAGQGPEETALLRWDEASSRWSTAR